jgi:hypothetical protein
MSADLQPSRVDDIPDPPARYAEDGPTPEFQPVRAPPLAEVLLRDDTLPLDPVVLKYWIKDLQNPLRQGALPLIRIVASLQLYVVYFLKRVLPFQFRAHRLLQRIICFFMKWFVRPEANYLILHHFGTESNLINFVIANSRKRAEVPFADLYPELIRDLMRHTFVHHDAALLRALHALGSVRDEAWPVPPAELAFAGMKPVVVKYHPQFRKWTQFLDFETAHELFKVTFCLLVTAAEYEAAINSFQFDHSLAVRIGRILGDPSVADLAHNRFPLVLVGTVGLGRRFVLHGLFVEQLHERLVRLAAEHGVALAPSLSDAAHVEAAR